MEQDTADLIDTMRKKLDDLFSTFTVEDFKRIHAKFFGGLLSVETHFKRRFPEEWAKYEDSFYGEDK